MSCFWSSNGLLTDQMILEKWKIPPKTQKNLHQRNEILRRLNQIRTCPPLTLEIFWQVFTVHLMPYYLYRPQAGNIPKTQGWTQLPPCPKPLILGMHPPWGWTQLPPCPKPLILGMHPPWGFALHSMIHSNTRDGSVLMQESSMGELLLP
jgi:hypothetical protein